MGLLCFHPRQLPRALFICILLAAASSVAFSGANDQNLIEYSYGSYGNGDSRSGVAMLWPPLVKIYQGGKIIFYSKQDNRFYVGELDQRRLDRLKKKLANDKFFQRSRFLEMKGGFINEHGGLSYIRYLDGDDEILISTEVNPRGGHWMDVIHAIRDCLPKTYVAFYPEKIEIDIWENTSTAIAPRETPTWPFRDQLKLSSKPREIADAQIIRALFDRLEGSFSFFIWDFTEDQKSYSMVLSKAPNWFKDGDLPIALAQLKWEWEEELQDKTKKRKLSSKR